VYKISNLFCITGLVKDSLEQKFYPNLGFLGGNTKLFDDIHRNLGAEVWLSGGALA
jgi:hypothetical protein